jgi:hypothetical protein
MYLETNAPITKREVVVDMSKMSLKKILLEMDTSELWKKQRERGSDPNVSDDEVMANASLPPTQGPREKNHNEYVLDTYSSDFEERRIGQAILKYVADKYPEKFKSFKDSWDDLNAMGGNRRDMGYEYVNKIARATGDETLIKALQRYFKMV